MPRVLNVKRAGLPSGAVYIGRAMPRYRLRRSKWANPFKLRRAATREERDESVLQYEHWLCDSPEGRVLLQQIGQLRGKDLVCWCAPESCHGDVLLRLANAV